MLGRWQQSEEMKLSTIKRFYGNPSDFAIYHEIETSDFLIEEIRRKVLGD